MTYFIEDFKNYIVSNALITTGEQLDIEFYEESGNGVLTCIACYDSDPETGRYSIQILRRDKSPKKCLDGSYKIYNHFFNYRQQKPVYKLINYVKCLFKPISKPLFLKKENGLHYYTFNIEVWAQK